VRLALPALALAALSSAAGALEVPFLSARVNDDARLLDAGTAARLEQTLKDYEERTGRQFAILTLPSLEGEALEDYTLKVARTWKLGRAGRNDGILLFVARDDRKVRIEVGYGLEGSLPDALCGRIVRGEIVPRFRSGDYSGGVAAGVDAVLAALNGTYSPPPDAVPMRTSGRNDFATMGLLQKILMSCFVFGILGVFEFVGLVTPGFGWFLYFFLIPFWSAFPMAIWGVRIGAALLGAHLIGFPILKMLLASTAWGQEMAKNARVHGNTVFIGGSGWSSGGGGWSSGGGGFSGGGGSFGGGGASGSW